MILKLRLGHYRVTMTFAKVIDVLGVNSKLSNGKHILMWDFDNHTLPFIRRSLASIQQFFELPNIYILRSSPPNNYIAYCFSSQEWAKARALVGMTIGIDENFYKWGVFRKRFTLRVGVKNGHQPECVDILRSPYEQDAKIEELKSWVVYETLDSHHKQWAKFIEVQ